MHLVGIRIADVGTLTDFAWSANVIISVRVNVHSRACVLCASCRETKKINHVGVLLGTRLVDSENVKTEYTRLLLRFNGNN